MRTAKQSKISISVPSRETLIFSLSLAIIMLFSINNHVVFGTDISCFGVPASRGDVCSGRGTCIAQDVCSCMGINDTQSMDYLSNVNITWGGNFATPAPNTLFSKYTLTTTSTYPNMSIVTKNQEQNMWSCTRDHGELILNNVPTHYDGSLYNEWSFEMTMNFKSRDSNTDLTHSGIVLWRDTSKNPSGKNYYLGIGPESSSKVSIPVNNELSCTTLAENLPNIYPNSGAFSVGNIATVIPLKVEKYPSGYKFYYKSSTSTPWILLGKIATSEVYDKVGIFVKQWTFFFIGGPMEFTVNGMNLQVPKYTGASCNITSCHGISSSSPQVCSGNGFCNELDSCTCRQGYNGSYCETRLDSTNNSMDGNSTNNSTSSNTTDPIVQPTNSTADSSNSTTNVTSSVNSTTCNGIDSKNETVCNSRGNCTSNGCSCIVGYTGSNCEAPLCNGKTSIQGGCSFNGNCTSPEHCVCRNKFNPDTFCIDCGNGYGGSNCENPICFSFQSSNSNVCNGHGSCIAPDECQCKTGYEGTACSSFTCFGVSKSSPFVCGGHGSCIDLDTCICATNWNGSIDCNECSPNFIGLNCTQVTCTEKTCNERGTCNSNNKCVCNSNAVGEFCEYCSPGYLGNNCDVMCSPVLNCSSQGQCSSNGTCVCSGHFYGKDCSTCQDGWYGDNCDYHINTNSFTFTSNGVITGVLYSSIKSQFNCSYFIASESESLIGGSEASCVYSTSSNVFQIILGPKATIVPGNSLKFYLDLQKHSLVSVVVSAGSLYLTPPQTVLKLDKTVVSTCEKVTLDASASMSLDRGALKFSWSSPSNSLNNIIASLNASVISIQATALTVGEYLATVKVTTQYGISSNHTVSFQVSTNIVPSIIVPEENQVLIGYSSIILPAITFPSCYNGNGSSVSVTYSVESNSVDPSLKLVVKERMIVFGPSFTSIKKEGVYYIKAKVSADQSLDTSVVFMVKAISQPLQLDFSVSDYSQGFDEAVKFNITKNDPSSTLDSESLSISCYLVSDSTSCGTVSAPFYQQLSPGLYLFTARYSKGSRYVEKLLKVKVLSDSKDKIIKASISAKPQGLQQTIDLSAVDNGQDMILTSNSLETLSSPVYKWYSSDVDLTGVESSLSYVVIPKILLVSGSSLSVFLNITDGIKTGSSSIGFVVNYPPTRGVFESYPQTGYALEDFDLKCGNGWTDPHTPLSYQYFFNDGAYWKPLSEKTVDLKSIRVKLASGLPSKSYMVPIKVAVSDAKGATTESIINITVQKLSLEKAFTALDNLKSQAASLSTSDASSTLLAIGGMSDLTLDSSQKEKVAAAANTVISSVFTSKAAQSDLVPETSDSATSTASFISNTIPAVNGGFIADTTTSLIISALASTTNKVANVQTVNFDSNTLSNALETTNALATHVSNRRRRSSNSFSANDLNNLDITYTNIVASSTKNDAPDMPASIVIGNGVVGYSRKLSTPNMNNFYDILYGTNTITLASNFATYIPNLSYASFRFMIYDKRNAISKFSLASDFEMFTKAIEFNIVPEKSFAPLSLTGSNFVKIRLQTLNNVTSIPQGTELVCRKYNDNQEVFQSDGTCAIGSFVKDAVVAEISSTGVYTLTSYVRKVQVSSAIISQKSISILCAVLMIVLMQIYDY